MRVGRQKPFGRGVDVGEVAAPAAGDQDLLPRCVGMVDHEHTLARLARAGGAHQARPSCAKDDNVIFGQGLCHAGALEQQRVVHKHAVDRSLHPVAD